MNSLTLNTAKNALTTTFSAGALLAVSLLSFNASATSPAHPSGLNQNIITSQAYSSSDYQEQEATKMFPMPEAGMEQHILTLPKLDDEANYMVEIQIGRTQMVDCNGASLMGELKQHSVQGWGYNYYQVDSMSEGPTTMMACFKQAEKEAFVQLRDELKIKYDSRLAKVFYLPEGSELRYRVWSVDSQFNISKTDAE
ncbi:serine protease inhibitor ecotin [Shewanella sp. UCD-KL12]|uniref:serine protease inhibitor ecotin n=1 Tax=Shewanella sp. UCD-KL12 TaxID=1917163 RepID=UPI0009704FFE|nr:serine protease inhibitor ecotin [Shewanella sp. UCD-KL12]